MMDSVGCALMDSENTSNTASKEDEVGQKLVGLEMKISFVEDFLEKIQDVCVEHTKEIQSLKAENTILKLKIAQIEETLAPDVPSQKPPHY